MTRRVETRIKRLSPGLRAAASDCKPGEGLLYRGRQYEVRECGWDHSHTVDHCLGCAPLWGLTVWRVDRE